MPADTEEQGVDRGERERLAEEERVPSQDHIYQPAHPAGAEPTARDGGGADPESLCPSWCGGSVHDRSGIRPHSSHARREPARRAATGNRPRGHKQGLGRATPRGPYGLHTAERGNDLRAEGCAGDRGRRWARGRSLPLRQRCGARRWITFSLLTAWSVSGAAFGRTSQSIVQAGRLPTIQISELKLNVLPIQHASGANPSFWGMLRNQALISVIRQALGIETET